MKITLNCEECKKEFLKEKNEFDRRIRLGKKKFFCGNRCATIFQHKYFPPRISIINVERIKLYANNRRDDLTPFRWFLLRIKQRKRKGKTDLSLQDLKGLWELQKGICPITGWNLLLPFNTNGWEDGANPANASLDRIDNNLGYIQGNVRFIALMANFARQSFSDEELFCFCKAVAKKQNK